MGKIRRKSFSEEERLSYCIRDEDQAWWVFDGEEKIGYLRRMDYSKSERANLLDIVQWHVWDMSGSSLGWKRKRGHALAWLASYARENAAKIKARLDAARRRRECRDRNTELFDYVSQYMTDLTCGNLAQCDVRVCVGLKDLAELIRKFENSHNVNGGE